MIRYSRSNRVYTAQVSKRRNNERQLDLWAETPTASFDSTSTPLGETSKSIDSTSSPLGSTSKALNRIPDVRDGLTREQRIILYALYEAEKERPGRRVPTLMLYGRVCEYLPMPKERFMSLLSNLVGRGVPGL